MTRERVEFVDHEPAVTGDDDVVEFGGDPAGPPGSGRTWWFALAGVLVLVAAVLVGRSVAGGDDRTPAPAPSPSRSVPATPVTGQVALPRVFGEVRELVGTRTGDDVWALDRGAGVVRLEGGRVEGVQLFEAQVTAIAVDPQGQRLYVATAGDAPALQIVDARTLTLGRTLALDRTIQSLAVGSDALWATSGGRLLRLDLLTLDKYADIALSGVVIVSHLRVSPEYTGADEAVTGLAAFGDGVSRLVRVLPPAPSPTFGPALPAGVSVAEGQLLTWVSSPADDGSRQVTEGFGTAVDAQPQAVATPPLFAGSRVWDAGGGYPAFYTVGPDSSRVGCRDAGGFAVSDVDVALVAPGATVTGQVLASDRALYAVTDRGLVRTGVGSCR